MVRCCVPSEFKTRRFYTACLAEILGTMFLVLVGCGSCSSPVDVVRISLTFTMAISTIVWNVGRVSGGHLNPAVTIGFLVARRITVGRALFFIISQVIGALIGAVLLKGVIASGTTFAGLRQSLGTSGPSAGVTDLEVFGVELLITFVLVWTVFATVDGRRTDTQGSKPLAIGMAIGMCHLWAVPYTGAGMNPARVVGPAIVSGTYTAHWAYWAGPIVGGIAAALIYEFIFAVNATSSKIRGWATTFDYEDDEYDNDGKVMPVTNDNDNKDMQMNRV
jgi:aquaporin-4